MVFWRLYTLQIAILAALGASWYFGYIDYVMNNDSTRLSVIILILFICSSVWVGVLAVKDRPPTQILWFMADTLTGLGMMGTVIGVAMVLIPTLSSISSTDVEVIVEALMVITGGVGTALITTIVGLGSAMLLKLELVILEG
jgi:hypothetical protein